MPTVMIFFSCIKEVDRAHLLQWLQSSTSVASRIKGIIDGKVIIIASNVRTKIRIVQMTEATVLIVNFVMVFVMLHMHGLIFKLIIII